MSATPLTRRSTCGLPKMVENGLCRPPGTTMFTPSPPRDRRCPRCCSAIRRKEDWRSLRNRSDRYVPGSRRKADEGSASGQVIYASLVESSSAAGRYARGPSSGLVRPNSRPRRPGRRPRYRSTRADRTPEESETCVVSSVCVVSASLSASDSMGREGCSGSRRRVSRVRGRRTGAVVVSGSTPSAGAAVVVSRGASSAGAASPGATVSAGGGVATESVSATATTVETVGEVEATATAIEDVSMRPGRRPGRRPPSAHDASAQLARTASRAETIARAAGRTMCGRARCDADRKGDETNKTRAYLMLPRKNPEIRVARVETTVWRHAASDSGRIGGSDEIRYADAVGRGGTKRMLPEGVAGIYPRGPICTVRCCASAHTLGRNVPRQRISVE